MGMLLAADCQRPNTACTAMQLLQQAPWLGAVHLPAHECDQRAQLEGEASDEGGLEAPASARNTGKEVDHHASQLVAAEDGRQRQRREALLVGMKQDDDAHTTICGSEQDICQRHDCKGTQAPSARTVGRL